MLDDDPKVKMNLDSVQFHDFLLVPDELGERRVPLIPGAAVVVEVDDGR